MTQIQAEVERCQQQQLVMKIEVIPKRDWQDKIVAGFWVPLRVCSLEGASVCVVATVCMFQCGCLCVCFSCGCPCVCVSVRVPVCVCFRVGASACVVATVCMCNCEGANACVGQTNGEAV